MAAYPMTVYVRLILSALTDTVGSSMSLLLCISFSSMSLAEACSPSFFDRDLACSSVLLRTALGTIQLNLNTVFITVFNGALLGKDR